MANSIAYAKEYAKMLDRVFKQGASTALLNPVPGTFKYKGAKTVSLRKMTLEGLGNYSRATGYTTGDTDIAWTDYQLSVERSKKLTLDAMDLEEARTEIAEIAQEFQRLSVTPEIDALRFEKMCTRFGIDVNADLTYDNVLDAIDTGIETLDDNEVPNNNRILFVSNATYKKMKASGEFFNIRIAKELEPNINREIETFDGMPLVRVPNARFYNDFDFSATDGFSAASGSYALNFMIVDKASVVAPIKYAEPKIIAPAQNHDGNFWIYAYLLYHDCFVPDNKVNGGYVHAVLTAEA